MREHHSRDRPERSGCEIIEGRRPVAPRWKSENICRLELRVVYQTASTPVHVLGFPELAWWSPDRVNGK